ncbi:MAG: helix-turn-helix transcriptional regulator [Bdellovibrionaceae bacterium]|nr:helix-turn-helix transcriptional regulator [Pseudobdellovibrionaceae bacterium]
MARKKKGPGGRRKLNDRDKKRGVLLAKAIKDARNKLDMKQEDLAIQASIRIDTLRSIESARVYSPSAFIIADLAKVLGEDLNKWLK